MSDLWFAVLGGGLVATGYVAGAVTTWLQMRRR